jgi:predicted nucleic acid-binding protein
MYTYFDSGSLVKIYVKERCSEEVISLAAAEKQIPLFPLHELEIRNALRAQVGRNYLLIEEFEGAFTAFNEDIHASRLKQICPDWSFIYKKAEELSSLHSTELLCRALDILHVACAQYLSCNCFITGDKRQANLAERANLKVHLIGKKR